jgi:hypothetical protein
MKFHKDNTDNLLTAKMVKESRKRIEKAREIGEAKRKVDEETAIIQEKRKKRTDAYPSITDQLDMLWHDIDNGNISANVASGTWYRKIKAVKESNPL